MLSVAFNLPKLFNFAVLDIILVILMASLMALITNKIFKCLDRKLLFYDYLMLLFGLGIWYHYYYNIPTPLNYYLCLNNWESIVSYPNSSIYGLIGNGTVPTYC